MEKSIQIERIRDLLAMVDKYNHKHISDNDFAELKVLLRMVGILQRELDTMYKKQTGLNFIA